MRKLSQWWHYYYYFITTPFREGQLFYQVYLPYHARTAVLYTVCIMQRTGSQGNSAEPALCFLCLCV